MNKIKLLINAAIVIVILAMIATINYQDKRIKRQADDIERLKYNIDNLLEENAKLVTINLKNEEITGIIKRQRDSLARELSLKPKQIIKYIDRNIIQHDTIVKIVQVDRLTDTTYYLIDKGECFRWEGLAIIENKELEVKRLLFDYNNEVIDVFFWKRTFPVFGKKKYYQDVKQKCGENYTKEINFVKRK